MGRGRGTGTWDVGLGDAGTWGRGDAGNYFNERALLAENE